MNHRAFRQLAFVAFLPSALVAQRPDFSPALHWRSIGPLRGGRTRAAAGDPTRPYTFYMAQVNGGVWKTDDAGRTWNPIFDDQPTQSVGAIAIAPSDPNTIYVGSGEGLPRPDLSVGDGVYKSSDGGKTWQHLGLRDAQQIPQIAVDPTNPSRIFVAALGHPYGPNKERGIFRSLDGGRTFTAVLQKSEDAGGNDVDIDPSNPQIIYANLWEQRQGPWENSVWTGNGGGLFKSTDGGDTWKQLTNGLPPTTNQVNLVIAPSNPRRLYAAVEANGPPDSVDIYRSDDAGESWTRITNDRRPALRIGGGDLPVPVVNPKDADMVLMGSVVAMKSTDGGRTWIPLKGAPGGDDYQNAWISPIDPNIVLLVSDQGAIVSVNGGNTWSSWYNQPTAQVYHVAADNAFPYRLCSGQQESGSACVSSRGAWGEITMRDWAPVGVDEYGYAAPDPLHPDIVYGGRSVTRFDRATGTVSTVGPLAGRTFAPGQNPFRQVRTQPVVFSEADPRTLFFGNSVLWKTRDGGITWQQISPDLTRKTWAIPASVGKYTDPALVQQRGVIYTIGPSPIDANVIWLGTDDGVVERTMDGGGNWTNVTPPQIGPWWKLFMIDAGHFDAQTAYAAVNTLRLDDMRPHFYRTHDGGRTWTDIAQNFTANGARAADLASLGPANSIREDPKKKGLLYAATEKGVWVSFDDGSNWESLRLNLPASSVRDLIIKDDDIAVATHGRGFWILDDITALRQMTPDIATRDAALFTPAPALRVRWNTNDDTPLPRDEPMAENPPEGASIDYYLKGAHADAVSLEILDARNRVVRRYTSADSLPWKMPDAATAAVPLYWYRVPRTLSGAAGLHRFQWDVRYQPISGLRTQGFGGGLPIAATPYNTAPSFGTPFVAPGSYTVRLNVAGKAHAQPITVKQDPRVTASPAAMHEVYALTDSMYWTLSKLQESIGQARAFRQRLTDSVAAAHVIAILDAPAPTTLSGASNALAGLLNSLQNADVSVTTTQRTAIDSALRNAKVALSRWSAFPH
ncbi:MAG: glycoside hydrolase [Gemmatimonadaceae bacterium]